MALPPYTHSQLTISWFCSDFLTAITRCPGPAMQCCFSKRKWNKTKSNTHDKSHPDCCTWATDDVNSQFFFKYVHE